MKPGQSIADAVGAKGEVVHGSLTSTAMRLSGLMEGVEIIHAAGKLVEAAMHIGDPVRSVVGKPTAIEGKGPLLAVVEQAMGLKVVEKGMELATGSKKPDPRTPKGPAA